MTTTPKTTTSGAANAGLHALADRIEEAQGRAICISVESADYLRKALAECAPVAPTQHIVLSDEQIKAHGDRASGMMARDLTRFDAACEVMKYLKEQGAPYYYIYRMSIVLHGNYEGTEVARAPDKAAPVAPAPQPAAPKKKPLPDLMMAAYHEAIGWNACVDAMNVAAAPKAAPAINKVSDIIDAYGMTPGQPERVADIPGLAEALEAAFADGSAQVTGAAPPHQGEYLPLPKPDTHCYDEDRQVDVWSYSASQVLAYLDADRAARGAAQPEGGAKT